MTRRTEHEIGDGWFAEVIRNSAGDVLALSFNNPQQGHAVSLGFNGTKGLLALLDTINQSNAACNLRGKLGGRRA